MNNREGLLLPFLIFLLILERYSIKLEATHKK